ncbi:hypothetical protein [Leekyejoonella antrihumi]|uniref:Peptidase MA-like domain-containing protein n=1 Tax=Leekyejoonella antrihumi TaxID=1660198 RepID=A0A563E379_9MICO|nr:hypothetical protein [Leekyejoonella antrihumi]TWP36986.1 hypothetical protein FGL98_07985 [Leekyejoonella antrihumi]
MGRTRWGCGVVVGAVMLAGCGGAAAAPSSPTAAATPSGTVARVMPDAENVRGTYVVVTGDASESRLRHTVQAADQAARWVTQTWGDVWRGRARVVVYAPRSMPEFLALGGGSSEGDQVSATTTVAGAVVLSPELSTEVTPEGQVVVLAHELTHVALHQAGLTHTRRWVIEGSAELTAYRPTGLSVARAAPQVAVLVRSGRSPAGPPTDEAFSGSSDDLQISYQQAYTWCRFLGQKFGLPAFKRFVKQADRGATETAFRDQFHTTPAGLADTYRTWLRTTVS